MHMYIIVTGVILLVILWSFLEQKFLMTTKYTIKSKRLPKQLDNTNFVVLADLHNCTFGKNNRRLLKRINALSPEFIIVAGDMINYKTPCCPSNAFTLLSQLSDKYEIYYAYGNHEQKIELFNGSSMKEVTEANHAMYTSWVEFKKKLVSKRVHFLNNESLTIIHKGCKLCITGISIGEKFFERNKMPVMEPGYLTALVGKCSDEFQLLISHNPIYFHSYVEWGADLTVSGHLHGGIVRLPGIGGIVSPQVRLFPKYDSGIYEENNRYLVVSRGLGSHSNMPRLFNVPELITVKLKAQEK